MVAAGGLGAQSTLTAQQGAGADVTYTKDIAPILQRSCENCHRPGGGGQMPLTTYEEVRPWARAIKQRTGIGPHAGVMPPWYMEKNIGIQRYKDDPSLSATEVALVAKWVDSGAPRGNPNDMPPPRQWADANTWRIGTPDLIVKSKDIVVKANAPDWWGEIEPVPIPLDDDRYVLAVEIKEVNDAALHNGGRDTVGGLFVRHHLIYRTQPGADYVASEVETVVGSDNVVNWPVHEVGRNPDYFDPKSAVLLKKGSWIFFDSLHTHSSGKDVTSHLEFGYKLAPKGYTPAYKRAVFGLGNGVDIDIAGMKKDQLLHAYAVLNESTKITEPRWIKMVEIRPANIEGRKILHHSRHACPDDWRSARHRRVRPAREERVVFDKEITFATITGGNPLEPYAGKASGTVTFGAPEDYVVHITINDYSGKGDGVLLDRRDGEGQREARNRSAHHGSAVDATRLCRASDPGGPTSKR